MKGKIEVQCQSCLSNFMKWPGEVKKSKRHFCSRSCAAKFNNQIVPKRSLSKQCILCDIFIPAHRKFCDKCYPISLRLKKTKRPNKYHKRIRQPQSHCKDCRKKVTHLASRCIKCTYSYVAQQGNSLTLQDMINDSGLKCNSFSSVRGRARTKAKQLGWTQCKNCGYSKHIQISHRRSVTDFPLTATIGEVNHIDNLIPLCPNCHWEFDHGMLDL